MGGYIKRFWPPLCASTASLLFIWKTFAADEDRTHDGSIKVAFEQRFWMLIH